MKVSNLFDRCIRRAIALEDDLFPCDCLDILQEEYKGRMDYISQAKMIEMISNLMQTLTEADYKDDIKRIVNDFMDS